MYACMYICICLYIMYVCRLEHNICIIFICKCLLLENQIQTKFPK